MSEPSGELREALEPWLRADAGVIASFNGQRVKVYKTLPPVNAEAPYIFLAGFLVSDEGGDCYDGAVIDVQIDVWSLMKPQPGFAEAEGIAASVKAALKAAQGNPAFTLPTHRLVFVELVSTTYLTDPSDGKTVHAVIAARLSVDPI